MRALLGFGLSLLCALLVAPAALASPVATSDAAYALQGRVFTDPLGGCQNLGSSPCDPNAEGNNPAVSFIGVNEFRDGLEYMNTKPEWQRYMEVMILDGKDGDGSNTKAAVDADPSKMFPGDQLKPEFSPKPEYVSAGLPTTGLGRQKSDLTIIRVTDETVPDAGKKRMALSLSIHGIERAGIEGGTRAMEDLVTAATAGNSDKPILPEAVRKGAPTFAQTLRNTVIYFTFPNPDGWRRGTIDTGGFSSSFQRYNGNGVDPNRDYTDLGYNFRGYSGGSEPETRAFKGTFRDILGTGATFQAGDDLHGQPFADALSYTLLPHGQHDLAKDTRIRETAKTINRAQYEATKWNPRIKENVEISEPQTDCLSGSPAGDVCPQIYAQTWGSVYDTINYTTTGTLGDWFDSTEGLSADGIDNEMSFSHIDKQIRFEQDTEQLHVAGNKSIIFAHLADILAPKSGSMDVPGPQGYVPNVRLTRGQSLTTFAPPADTEPQPDIVNANGIPDPSVNGAAVYPFTVERTNPTPGKKGIFNGGMRVEATSLNFGGASTGAAGLQVQCQHCDDHVGAKDADEDDWITVAEDYNQSPVYAQAGAVAAVNLPDALYTDKDGKVQKVKWRAVVSTLNTGLPNPPVRIDVDFSSGPATDDGNTGGDEAPVLKAYDVANTDFFDDLNRYIPQQADRFQKISPKQVLSGQQKLDGLHTLVLADELLPGYKKGADTPAQGAGPKTADKTFSGTIHALPGQGADGCPATASGSVDNFDFTIPATDDNAKMDVHIEWFEPITDWDLHVLKKKSDGTYQEIGTSEESPPVTEENVSIANPGAGDYRIAAVFCLGDATDTFTGTVKFTGRTARATAQRAAATDSLYTDAERAAWIDKLKAYVAGGGNLVLTDKALTALPDLGTGIPASKINAQTVYVGQIAVTRCKDKLYDADGACQTEERSLDDPLLKNLNQPGSRYNTGFRRQMYESTPLGFAIQDATGGDESHGIQYDIDAKAFTDAKGRVAATSADAGARDAVAVTNRVTVGEIPVGDKGGHIRVAGALLPQPSDKFDHPLGLASYAVTYSGYIVACNLLDANCKVENAPNRLIDAPVASPTPVATPPGDKAPDFGLQTICASRSGFKSTSVKPVGRGLRFGFQRRLDNKVTIDVFRSTKGKRLLPKQRVAHFAGKTKGFRWNGASAKGDGLYFVRFKTKGRQGNPDVRRYTLSRSGGRFSKRRSHFRAATCDLLRSFNLRYPAFGGRTGRPLQISYKLARKGAVSLVVKRAGGQVVKRFGARPAERLRLYRIRLESAGLRRGDYTVTLTATRGKKTLRARLLTRRL